MHRKFWGIAGALVVVAIAIGLGFLYRSSPNHRPNLEYPSLQPQQPRLLLSESQKSTPQTPSEKIQRHLNRLYVSIQTGDPDEMRSSVIALRALGPVVLDQIRETLSEIGWSNISKRRKYFYIVGLLKFDEALPLIDEEVAKKDEVLSLEVYKTKLGLAVSDEALRDTLLHHGTDVLVGENGTIHVSYLDSQIAALRALGMMKSIVAKAKLRAYATHEDLGPITQAAVQTYLAIATDAERKDLLAQITEEKMHQLLVPADFTKFFPSDPNLGDGETDKSQENE